MSIEIATARTWARAGERVAVATVVGVKRSAPRPPGTKMAVSESGAILGAVSGGCVEGAVVEVAEEIMHSGAPRLLHYGISDEQAWDVGLQCGGEIDVWVERFEVARELGGEGPAALVAAFQAATEQDKRAALVTILRGGNLGAKLLMSPEDGVRGTLGGVELDKRAADHAIELMWLERSDRRSELGVEFFVDVTAPAPRLVIVGAVDYAAALSTVARFLGWRPYVVDPRARFADASRFPDADAVIADWPQAAFARVGGIDRATAVVVLTHDPKIDDAALTAALSSDAGYIGAMGSRRAQEARRERLGHAGVDEASLERVTGPVGLDVGALTAEETALSVMAELLAVRRNRLGGRLSENRVGRIHAEMEIGTDSRGE